MDFTLTDEQQMLQDSARKYVEKNYTFAIRKQIAKDGGFSEKVWADFAEMGWLLASVPEANGGLGFGPVETAILAEEIGRGLMLEPYLQCAVFPIALLRHCARTEQQETLLPALGSGDQLFSVAHSEAETRGSAAWISTRSERQSDGSYRLSGRKSAVACVVQADRILVTARASGESDDPSGISLFVIDRTAPGVVLDGVRLLDGTPAADVVLNDVVAPAESLLGEAGAAHDGLQRAIDEAIVAQCAETVGGMEDVLALCSDYLKTRKQFGVAIGSFQALQHRMADMAIELMQARASLHRALATLADPDIGDRSIVISGCKAQVMRSAKFVTAQGIQLHGGYGITEEYRVGHHYRRLVLTDAWFGNMEYHLSRYSESIRWAEV